MADRMLEYLKPMHEKRKELEADPDRLDKIVALAKKHGIHIVLAGGGALGNDKINVDLVRRGR